MISGLQRTVPQCKVDSTNELGIYSDHLVAMALPSLAYAYQAEIAGNIPSDTDPNREALLDIYCPYL